ISSGSGADTIKFSVTGTIELSDKLPELNGDLTITGPGANLLTVSGAKSYRLFTIINSDTTAAISGLTLSNGRDSFRGGGIYNSGTLTLTNCTVSGNKAHEGGGIYNNGSKMTLTDCTVSDNIANGSFGSGRGGGIFNDGGTLELTNCTVSGNTALTDFGG